MNSITLKPELVERAFHALTPEDRVEVFGVGAAFHRLSLAKKLEQSERKVREFEARYHKTLAQVEAEGLPDEADYVMHEDYFEWRYWSRTQEQTQKALNTLSLLLTMLEPS